MFLDAIETCIVVYDARALSKYCASGYSYARLRVQVRKSKPSRLLFQMHDCIRYT